MQEVCEKCKGKSYRIENVLKRGVAPAGEEAVCAIKSEKFSRNWQVGKPGFGKVVVVNTVGGRKFGSVASGCCTTPQNVACVARRRRLPGDLKRRAAFARCERGK